MRMTASDSLELVDAIVSAVDIERSDEIERVRAALASVGLDQVFNDEIRLSGVPSATWQRCEFCGDVIDQFEVRQEAA